MARSRYCGFLWLCPFRLAARAPPEGETLGGMGPLACAPPPCKSMVPLALRALFESPGTGRNCAESHSISPDFPRNCCIAARI